MMEQHRIMACGESGIQKPEPAGSVGNPQIEKNAALLYVPVFCDSQESP